MSAAYAGAYCFFMAAATGLFIAATVLTLHPFMDVNERCGGDDGKSVIAMKSFMIVVDVLAPLGLIFGILHLIGKGIKVASIGLAAGAFLLSIPSWGIAAHFWKETDSTDGVSTATLCALADFDKFLPMVVAGSGAAMLAMIVAILMPEEDAEKKKDDEKKEDAGAVPSEIKTEEKKPEEKKPEQETPKPAENNKAEEEEKERQRKEQEAAELAERQRIADEQAAAQKKREEDEAARAEAEEQRKFKEQMEREAEEKRKQEQAAAAQNPLSGKPAEAINWKELSSKLPYEKGNKEQKALRFEWHRKFDKDGRGKVNLKEVVEGMEAVLGLDPSTFDHHVLELAFTRAASAGQKMGVNEEEAHGEQFLEKNEMRLFCMNLRMLFELNVLFEEIDTSGDGKLSRSEFDKACELLPTWGVDLSKANLEDEWKELGGQDGEADFKEFATWSGKFPVDCPNDDD